MKQAIVTGASKGIGKAFANELAAAGYDLLLVARSEKILLEEAAQLSKTFGINARVLALDLGDQQASVSILNWCEQNQFII